MKTYNNQFVRISANPMQNLKKRIAFLEGFFNTFLNGELFFTVNVIIKNKQIFAQHLHMLFNVHTDHTDRCRNL